MPTRPSHRANAPFLPTIDTPEILRTLPRSVLPKVADEMREVRTICHCGKKATMVVRKDAAGQVLTDGAQVQIGGNETYESLCRRHWRQAVGR